MGVNFILQKLCQCKKMTIIRYANWKYYQKKLVCQKKYFVIIKVSANNYSECDACGVKHLSRSGQSGHTSFKTTGLDFREGPHQIRRSYWRGNRQPHKIDMMETDNHKYFIFLVFHVE